MDISNVRPHHGVQDLRELARVLDAQFRLPFGLRIGWDGILGFIPGVGDVITNLASFYILYKSALLGCPPAVLMRMGLNILIDNILDMIPLIGNFFDFFWKANIKNIALAEAYVDNPRLVVRSSRAAIAATLTLMALMLLAFAWIAVLIAIKVWTIFEAWVTPATSVY